MRAYDSTHQVQHRICEKVCNPSPPVASPSPSPSASPSIVSMDVVQFEISEVMNTNKCTFILSGVYRTSDTHTNESKNAASCYVILKTQTTREAGEVVMNMPSQINVHVTFPIRRRAKFKVKLGNRKVYLHASKKKGKNLKNYWEFIGVSK